MTLNLKLVRVLGTLIVTLSAAGCTSVAPSETFAKELAKNDEGVRKHLVTAAAHHVQIAESAAITEVRTGRARSVLAASAAATTFSAEDLAAGATMAFGYFDGSVLDSATMRPLAEGFYAVRITADRSAIDKVIAPDADTSARSENAYAELVSVQGGEPIRVPAAFGRRKGSTGDEPKNVVWSTASSDRIIAYCMRVGGRWVCWGSHWMEALDALMD